ncbi:Hypothetical predicted protein [Olea europaea subsp. europaea]|uniref:Uncharacterized protein n=1 Tax=Olea europaea subsp. europaea TaxID=158383 RepID=A0A8S0T0F0_OLEEU|nr:Hypothetical predicted protein [Olea europaea subsp. europaea]
MFILEGTGDLILGNMLKTKPYRYDKAKKIWAFEVMPEIGDRFARRLGHQSPRLLIWTCTKQQQQRTYDAFFKNIKLYVSATLHPIEAELGQPYISTLLPFEDRTVPVLDNVARDIIPPQLHPEPLASGGNVGNSRGECALVSSGGGSEDDEETGDSDDEGDDEEIGGDKSGNNNGEASNEGDSQTSGASLMRAEVEELLLNQRTLIKIRLCTIKLEIMQHVTDEFVKVRDFISTLVPHLSLEVFHLRLRQPTSPQF